MFYHCTRKNKIDKKSNEISFMSKTVSLVLDERVFKKLRKMQTSEIIKNSKSVSISVLINKILLENFSKE